MDFCETCCSPHLGSLHVIWTLLGWLTLFQSFCLWSLLAVTATTVAAVTAMTCPSETHPLLTLPQRSGFLDQGVPAFGSPFSSGSDSLTGWGDVVAAQLALWGSLGPCGQASTSLQASVFSYPCTRQRSRPVMGTRWGFMCLNKDTFWTIRNNWVAVYPLNPNLTAVLAPWPRINRAKSPLCCPDQMIPRCPCFWQGGLCT